MYLLLFKGFLLVNLITYHNCMAKADRAVVVFVKELQWDEGPQPLQNNSIHLNQKLFIPADHRWPPQSLNPFL